MGEKILVTSERYNVKRGLCIFFICVAVIGMVCAFGCYIVELQAAKLRFEECSCSIWFTCLWHEMYSSPADCAWTRSGEIVLAILGTVAGIGVICLQLYFWLRSYEMIVTDKRVYGQTAFGKRVDLPIDSVSAIGSSWPKGIAVATASGRIAFLMIKNGEEIHKCVSDLLIERQNASVATSAPVAKEEVPQSNADELKKYKELLDMGAITQEEFDKKKKQLLNL